MADRCLYIATVNEFLEQERLAVLGALHNNYHGEALTTTDEAWMGEIDILQQVLLPWKEENAQVIFEYEIPRLGKCPKASPKTPHACRSSMTELTSI